MSFSFGHSYPVIEYNIINCGSTNERVDSLLLILRTELDVKKNMLIFLKDKMNFISTRIFIYRDDFVQINLFFGMIIFSWFIRRILIKKSVQKGSEKYA